MSEPNSELIEISKLNGDFKRNYGKLLGAVLYPHSISAARNRSFFGADCCSRCYRPAPPGWSSAACHGCTWGNRPTGYPRRLVVPALPI